MSTTRHRHECAQWKRDETCEAPCVCECGAVLRLAPDGDGIWAWQRPDDGWDLWEMDDA